MARQGLPFRGHLESSESENRGNFIELLSFVAKYSPELKHWLSNHPGNVSWLSPSIQNEVIDIVSENILKTISERAKGKFFSVLCDEVSDVSRHEYLTLVIRYVTDGKIEESLLGLIRVESITGSFLCSVVEKRLSDYNLPLQNIVGQCYDGASNMSGQYQGLQALIKEKAGNRAMFVHCHAHILNLVVCDSAEGSILARDTFSVLRRLYAFFSTSPKRHAVYVRNIKLTCNDVVGRKLLQLSSATRWTARSDNLEAVHNCLPAIIESLREIEQWDSDAGVLLHSIMNFNFVLAVAVLHRVLVLCRTVSEYLQSSDMDMLASLKAVADLTCKLQEMRDSCDTSFNAVYDDVSTTCNKSTISIAVPSTNDPQLKRRRQAPTHLQGQFVMDRFLSNTQSSSATNVLDNEQILRIDFYIPLPGSTNKLLNL